MDSHVKKLIEGAISGDEAAFEKLIEPWRKTILYKCIRLTNMQEADDTAQEALLNIFNSISTLKKPEKFEAWMNAVINRTCARTVKRLEKDRSRTVFVNPEDYEGLIDDYRSEFLPQEYAEDKAKRELLMKVIGELTPEHREVLLLFYYEEKTYKEITEIMEKSEKQITNLLSRAKYSIKKKLEKETNSELIFSVMPIGVIPILSKAFQADADSLITEQMCENLTAGLREAMSSGNNIQNSSYAGSSAQSATLKIFIGIVAVSGLIATAILSSNRQDKSPPPEDAPVQAAEEIATERTVAEETAAATVEPAPSASTADSLIITIEDMIGEEYKELLLVFEAGDVDETSWQEFFNDIGAKLENVTYAQDGTEYRIYVLQKQDKQLLLFERKDTIGGKLNILYQFGSQAEGIPYMIDVIMLFKSIE